MQTTPPEPVVQMPTYEQIQQAKQALDRADTHLRMLRQVGMPAEHLESAHRVVSSQLEAIHAGLYPAGKPKKR